MATNTQAETQPQSRYICPIDHTALISCEQGWYCRHENGKGEGHVTVLAYDTKEFRECVVRQFNNGIMPVARASDE
jgi:hypothetical protein